MTIGFLLVAVAGLCSASAAVLQSIGARRVGVGGRPDARLLWHLIRSGPYAAGLALDGASSGLTFTALRSVPLFAVQALGAANLGLIAVLGAVLLRVRLRRREWAAVVALVCGLGALLVSARASPPRVEDGWVPWGLLAVSVGLAALAYLAGPRMRSAALPGLIAGLSFGAAATGARLVGTVDAVAALPGHPAAYAVAVAGMTGTTTYAMALQRGSITVASAMSVAGQTIAPAIVGWLLLGDGVRSGFAVAAVAGFALSVSAAVALARHAHSNRTADVTPVPCDVTPVPCDVTPVS